jgi:UDP-N-acetylmuramoyl-tripeptide--D-alanyl-D-alanine ligase
MTTGQVARAVGGQAHGPAGEVSGAATDSRVVVPGQLFVPLRAARDGHDFIGAALSAGAAAYLSERGPGAGTCILVDDTAGAFCRLAAHARAGLDIAVVGITGSVGKTTTKELVAAVLGSARTTHASPKSFNNSIGVPLTVLNAPDDVEALVVEMGANAPGEIEQLCAIARPTVGVVTKVAPAHTLGFGGIEGVARAKGALVAALPSSGTAVLNADDPRVLAMAGRTEAAVITFGTAPGTDVQVLSTELGNDLRARVRMGTPWGLVMVTLAVRGAHQVYNAAAAVAATGALGAAPEQMEQALATTGAGGKRMDLRTAPNGLRVIDDSYNASPAAMEAAFAALASAPARRRVAVLGAMAELGDISVAEHRRVAERAADLGIEVLAVAAPEYGAEQVEDIGAAIRRLSGLGEGDIVLVKGSREAGLEVLADALALAGGPAGPQ